MPVIGELIAALNLLVKVVGKLGVKKLACKLLLVFIFQREHMILEGFRQPVNERHDILARGLLVFKAVALEYLVLLFLCFNVAVADIAEFAKDNRFVCICP